MSEKINYKEHSSISELYSPEMKQSLDAYKSILLSEKSLANYNKKYPTTDIDINNALNPNIPVTNKELHTIIVEGKPIKINEQFYNYKTPAAQLFTNFKSAGENAILENMAVRNLPLKSQNNIEDPNLVLSNNNFVRANLQDYGKTFLLKTNMLNAEALYNGFAYQSASTSPYRLEDPRMLLNYSHSNFMDKEHGDIYFNSKYQLRFDLPTNYINNSVTTWQYVNPAFIIPNKVINSIDNIKSKNYLKFINKYFDKTNAIFHLQQKYGTLMLDSMKYVGNSCLTKKFSTVPTGYSKPVDVMQDNFMYPPVNNPNYYSKGTPEYMKKQGELHNSSNGRPIPNVNEGMYCSGNNNYVVMPKNFSKLYSDTDSSINIMPGMNSVTMGVVMSSALKKFINEELYDINKMLVVNNLYKDNIELTRMLESKYKVLNTEKSKSLRKLNHTEIYNYLYNLQRDLNKKYEVHHDVSQFIHSLVIIKFGGEELVDNMANVIMDNTEYTIKSPMFLLLPSCPGEDIMNLKKNTVGQCKDYDCCFKGPSESWLSNEDKNYIPNIFNNKKNLNNDLYNLQNPDCGINPYNAPRNF